MHFDRRTFLASAAAGVASGHGLRFYQASSAVGETSVATPGRPLVSLIGKPRDVGKQIGVMNARDIRTHVSDMTGDWRKKGLDAKQTLDKSRPFLKFAEKFGPHWLEESESCAVAAKTPVQDYVAFLAGKYRSLFFTDDCTSFAASGTATADGATIFHKNRDNATRSQSAYYKRLDVPGIAGFYGTGDTSDLGLMMMVNDHGLAGSADTGGLKETHPKGRGVMNPYILRLIAEKAERCEDALEIIQKMIQDGWYAGGATTGTHWLFADRHGKLLRVAQNSVREEHWYHRDTTVFLARGETPAAKKLNSKKGKLTVRDFQEAATSPDICFGSSISGLTVRIDPNQGIKNGTVWFALPVWAPSLPIYTAASGGLTQIADGTFFTTGYRLLKLRQGQSKTTFGTKLLFAADFLRRREEFQGRLYAESLRVETKFRELASRGENAESLRRHAEDASWKAWQEYEAWARQFTIA